MKWIWIMLFISGFSVGKASADVGCYLNGSDRVYTSPTGGMVGTPSGYNYYNTTYFDQCKPANPSICPCATMINNRAEVCYVGGAGGTRGSRWNFTPYVDCDLDGNVLCLLVVTGITSLVYLRKQPSLA